VARRQQDEQHATESLAPVIFGDGSEARRDWWIEGLEAGNGFTGFLIIDAGLVRGLATGQALGAGAPVLKDGEIIWGCKQVLQLGEHLLSPVIEVGEGGEAEVDNGWFGLVGVEGFGDNDAVLSGGVDAEGGLGCWTGVWLITEVQTRAHTRCDVDQQGVQSPAAGGIEDGEDLAGVSSEGRHGCESGGGLD
jgi:hypothetical protein